MDFFVYSRAAPDLPAPPSERLIVQGELSNLDDATPAGAVLALHAPSREAVEALLGRDGVQILDWEFGGRR